MAFFKGDRHRELLDQLSTAGTIGLHLVCSTFVGLAIGWYLDKWLGTKPWLLLVMLLFGIVAGFRNVVYEVQRIQKADAELDARGRRGQDKEPKDKDGDGNNVS
ncbi:ATP synthase protein I [Paucidesulfovibrio gracilis DSM 16080]|uniref:ATP synthase protein I n=1 Tax=Paucidesulfovibrio gracilis DSM 16080 TaxID=1121449 RepID=A0A1T4Y5N3_9BACT|nr:AtpZ/AtpI family protein [Paucidesulfovibrio gracilis]SKA97117.1 ATP synthase protein I [Paucidesulfovibrio gracilis DSM 16080]